MRIVAACHNSHCYHHRCFIGPLGRLHGPTRQNPNFDRRCSVPLSLPGLVFFIAELYTVCSAWKAHALVCVLLSILVVPSVAYNKITGKEAPIVYNDRLESFSTRSGLALHLAGDTSVGLWCVLCWAAMGYPPLMVWLQ